MQLQKGQLADLYTHCRQSLLRSIYQNMQHKWYGLVKWGYCFGIVCMDKIT